MTLWNETVGVVRGAEGSCKMNGKAFASCYPPGSTEDLARLMDKHVITRADYRSAIAELREAEVRQNRLLLDEIRADPDEIRRLVGVYAPQAPRVKPQEPKANPRRLARSKAETEIKRESGIPMRTPAKALHAHFGGKANWSKVIRARTYEILGRTTELSDGGRWATIATKTRTAVRWSDLLCGHCAK